VVDGLALILIAVGGQSRIGRHSLEPARGSTDAGGVWPIVDLGFDQMLVADTLTSRFGHPGRLAPNTALCLVLCGVHCGMRRSPDGRTGRQPSSRARCAGAGDWGGLGFGYLAGFSTYAWGQFTQMAANTGLGFVALGLGIVTVASLGSRRKRTPLRSGRQLPPRVPESPSH